MKKRKSISTRKQERLQAVPSYAVNRNFYMMLSIFILLSRQPLPLGEEGALLE